MGIFRKLLLFLAVMSFTAIPPWGSLSAIAEEDTSIATQNYQQKRQDANQRLHQNIETFEATAPQKKVTTAVTMPLAVSVVGFNPLVDYTKPNFAYSPNLRKFVDGLPGLTPANANNLGQYIPLAVPDTTLYSGSDYYEIDLKEYTEKMHTDLPATHLRGYAQANAADTSNRYLGPLILAKKGTPVRIKFRNLLSTSQSVAGGKLPIPVDTTIMGCNTGPLGGTEFYTQNRTDVHLHGGLTPWISDGTPHQWVTPAGDATSYKKGDAFQNVPDMIGAGAGKVTGAIGDGMATYYYPNEQSARLMFYHDHAYGITRLNVYDGVAAGYLLTDQVEDDLIAGTVTTYNPTGAKILPDQASIDPVAYKYGIPLVIQDKTFVNVGTPIPNFPAGYTPTPTTASTDPLWSGRTDVANWDTTPGGTAGNLWLPHEYMPNEDIYSNTGFNPLGRWDYGPFMIPPMLALHNTLPTPTIVPEAFMDTIMVNGTAFPTVTLPRAAIRFRILNACNDRMLNLQLFKAEPSGVTAVAVRNGGSGYDPGTTVTFEAAPAGGTTALGHPIVTGGVITDIVIDNPGAGYIHPPTVTFGSVGAGTGAVAYAAAATEVKMVPAVPNAAYPTWPSDGRAGGVPDPTTQGPSVIQIGNECGFLAKPAVIPPQPVDFDYSRRSVTFGGVTSKSLYIPPAVRADIIVDLSGATTGDTYILYNDAPAPMPLFDTRYDLFSDGSPAVPAVDQTAIGGAPVIPKGFGPGTRTVMQIVIGSGSGPGVDPALLAVPSVLSKAFAVAQDPILVPQAAYNDAYGKTLPDLNGGLTTFANSVDETLNVTGNPQQVSQIIATLPGSNYTAAGLALDFRGQPVDPGTAVPLTGAALAAVTPPTATIGLNGVTAITLTAGGTGYTSAPTVTIGAPGAGGVQATAAATVSGGVVTVISIINPGSNYNALLPPVITITGGGGAGATAVATVTAGGIGAITMTSPGTGYYMSPPQVYIVGGGGIGATAACRLAGDMVMTGKNLVEGFDMEYGRMNAVLGSTPNPLAPTVGAGPVIGMARYIDPPTEILKDGEMILWRMMHLGVDSHAIHFHLFNVQVVNRVDWTNTIKPPYEEELGWKETIRTNPFEDIILAIKPMHMNLPFSIPNSNRLLDPTTPAGSTVNFLPVAPPIGLPAVAQPSNVMTNFGWEYVWHCHLLGHEENDMMRPLVLNVLPPTAPTGLAAALSFPTPTTARVVLTWTNTDPVETIGYVVQRATNTGFTTGLVTFPTINGIANTTYTDNSVALRTRYYYRVHAIGVAGASPWSASVNVTTLPPPTTLTAVASRITGTTSDRVRLAWTYPTGVAVSGFTVQRANNAAFTGTITNTTVGSTARSLTVTNLRRARNYYFRIRANIAAGSSPYKNAVPFPVLTP